VDHYDRKESWFCFVMRQANPDPASRDVHLSSPAPASVLSGYNQIRGWSKECRDRNILGTGAADGIAEETICKAPHQFGRSLRCNDLCANGAPSSLCLYRKLTGLPLSLP